MIATILEHAAIIHREGEITPDVMTEVRAAIEDNWNRPFVRHRRHGGVRSDHLRRRTARASGVSGLIGSVRSVG